MRKALAQPHTKQFLKFAVVGLISFGIDWGMLIALVELFHLDFLMSTTVSFITSVVVNYWLSMKYVFDHREGMSRKREFTIFTILSVIGLGLNDLYMFVGVTFLSIGYQAMKPSPRSSSPGTTTSAAASSSRAHGHSRFTICLNV